MYFLVDNEKKIIFGWSAKCGCSHLKTIFYYLRDNKKLVNVHTEEAFLTPIPTDIENYITIIVCRNPFTRLISGFRDKYNINGDCRKYQWNEEELTFEEFVNEMLNNSWKKVDLHHFTPQTSERFDEEKLQKSKNLIVYDINNIDYDFLENLYEKEIPMSLLEKQNCYNINEQEIIEKKIFDKNVDSYSNCKISPKYFYNNELKDRVYNFFKNDFDFFKKFGFDYDVETCSDQSIDSNDF